MISSKAEIVEALRQTHAELVETVANLPAEALTRQPDEGWSAAEYLMHLNLSVKPVGKAMRLPPEKLLSLFGGPDHPSRSYDVLEALYRQALADGIRAEDAPRFVPQLPENRDNLQQDLLAEWNDNNARLLEAVAGWKDAQLDEYCISHPAFGVLTAREMLFFTIFHNRLHLKDIQTVAV